jgi:hypothetical protein
MRFVETPIFTAAIRSALTEEAYRTLQVGLLLRPAQGPVIPRSGGLRKVRWAGSGRGKRGGLRVIYYWHPAEETFYMLYVYAKNAQEDLTPSQLKTLRQLIQEELA